MNINVNDLQKMINQNIAINKERYIFNELNNASDENVDIPKQLMGMTFFLLIFVFSIPYLLFKNSHLGILEGYIPNVDMIATVLGFQREPYLHYKSYFKYLFNPNSETLYGFLSQTFINYLALLGLTFFISYYTFINKSISKGWARAFIMLPMTYLIPGNFIAYYMEKVNHYLDTKSNLKNEYIKDILVYGTGILSVLFFIFTEKFIIHYLSGYLVKFLSKYLG